MLTMFLFVAGVEYCSRKIFRENPEGTKFLLNIFSMTASLGQIPAYKDCLYRLLYVKMLLIYCDSQNINYM